jgi:hypothetical protein
MKTLALIICLLAPVMAHAATEGEQTCIDEAVSAMNKATPAHKQAAYNHAADACAKRLGVCYMRLTMVCPTVKPKKKVVVAPVPVVPDCKPDYRVVTRTEYKYITVPGAPYPVAVPVAVPFERKCNESQDAIVGLHLGVGVGARDPYVSGQIGLRFKYRPAYVGFEVFSALQYGVGIQSLAYVYQGPRVSVHVLDPGVLIPFSNKNLLSDRDIPRKVDLLLGAGVEVKILCHLAFTADIRTDIPDPAKLKDCVGSTGERIQAAKAVGNAFADTQVVLGLLVRN